MLKYYLKTYGCKVNQCDSDNLAARLESWDLQATSDQSCADLCIINTCTVTAVSDRKALKTIRATRKANPDVLLVATGCLTRRDPAKVFSTGVVDAVLDTQDAEGWRNLLKGRGIIDENAPGSVLNRADVQRYHSNRTRAFVKVQDGCDAACSYCIVPRVRGKPRSVPIEQVREKVVSLVETGTREIVVTGIHLGRYGKDVSSAVTLVTLLTELLEETGIERIRLSSIEVNEVTDELLELFSSSKRVQRHFHIPLQSADDAVLKRMNRHYGARDFRECIARIRQIDPDTGISTDIIVGFPGETDRAFENTFSLVKELQFSRLHVFKYSPRPGTVAATLPREVAPDVAKRRSDCVIELGNRLSEKFARKFVGKTLEVLIESTRDRDTGWLGGFTPNYLRVAARDADTKTVNEVVRVKIEEAVGPKAAGRITRENRGISSVRSRSRQVGWQRVEREAQNGRMSVL